MRNDRMAIPPVGWRVPYVIIYGEPGRPLIHSVRRPDEVLFEINEDRIDQQQASDLQYSLNRTLRPNDTYYIMKVIGPVLARCFSLIGADVIQWHTEMPKLGKVQYHSGLNNFHSIDSKKQSFRLAPHQGIITNYFVNMRCIGCETIVVNNNKNEQLCAACVLNPQKTILNLHKKIHNSDKKKHELRRICFSCANNTTRCQSLDCPVIYLRLNAESDVHMLTPVTLLLQKIS